MEQEQISRLIEKYKQGTATHAESDSLHAWYRETSYQDAEYPDEELAVQMRIFASLQAKINPAYKSPVQKSRRLWSRIAAAAAVFIVMGSGLFFYINSNHHVILNSVQDPGLVKNDIKPGTNKATLTLSNGSTIALTDVKNGTIAQQSGIQITKTANGQLVYSLQANTPASPLLPLGGVPNGRGGLASNTIETPRGGQYQVKLPDGSKVWLNAASKLTYPVFFNGREERRVELSGEAYFEVAKDKKHPFIVKTTKQEVQVLGTHFNINAYTDEPTTKTTLLEGSVRIATSPASLKEGWSKAGVVLKPNQQSILSSTTLNVKEIDAETAIDWKNGEFVFNKESLATIMRKVSRWYNIDIIYTGSKYTEVTFSGVVSRADNVSSILKMLQKTSKIKFTIEGDTVKVE